VAALQQQQRWHSSRGLSGLYNMLALLANEIIITRSTDYTLHVRAQSKGRWFHTFISPSIAYIVDLAIHLQSARKINSANLLKWKSSD
jgi:hypothetical protein